LKKLFRKKPFLIRTMFCCLILIITMTLLVSVEATSSSFNKCYYNDTSDQCSSGEQCAIVPPANSTVRRRVFYPDPDPNFFGLAGIQRRKSGSSGRSSKSSSSSSSSSSKSSTSSTSTSSSTSTGTSSYIRYGTLISRASYGSSTTGITSSPAMYRSTYYWWSIPLTYYSWRNIHDYDNLAENQGICVNETELRYMTQQDCYNWCMSLEYNDDKCANDCEVSDSGGFEIKGLIISVCVLLACCCGCCGCIIAEKKYGCIRTKTKL